MEVMRAGQYLVLADDYAGPSTPAVADPDCGGGYTVADFDDGLSDLFQCVHPDGSL
jgi:hypothetical protein